MKYVSGIIFAFSVFAAVNGLSWSKTYTLKAVLRIPSAGIEEPYRIWNDGETGNSRIDFYDGLNKMYKLAISPNSFIYYKVHPESVENGPSRNVCQIYKPSDNVVKVVQANNYLPNEKSFKLVDSNDINTANTSKWVHKFGYKIDGLQIQYTYIVWVANNNSITVPVRFDFHFEVEGKEMDYFRQDYSYFDPAKPDPKIFKIPNSIKCTIESIPVHEPVDPIMEYVNPMLEDERVSKAFVSYKLQNNKIYKDEAEHRERKRFFKNNLRFINSVNRRHKSYSLALNQFADLSDIELSKVGGLRVISTNYSQYIDDDDDFIGDTVNYFDWRDYNAVSPIKDQTVLCGSCYAFSSAAAIESTFYIHNGCRGQIKEISEQAIIDCTWRSAANRGNSGCDSGDLYYTMSYIKKHGVPTKDSYGPYIAIEGVCRSEKAGKKFKIKDFTKIPKNNKKIQKALVKKGPLALALNGHPKTFMFYSKGVYDNENCPNLDSDLTHAVTLIGFGEESGKEYWILKNSYGTKWGEDGFMRIASKSNICGVTNLVFGVQFKGKGKMNKCFLK